MASIHEHSIVMLENTLIAKNMVSALCNTHTLYILHYTTHTYYTHMEQVQQHVTL